LSSVAIVALNWWSLQFPVFKSLWFFKRFAGGACEGSVCRVPYCLAWPDTPPAPKCRSCPEGIAWRWPTLPANPYRRRVVDPLPESLLLGHRGMLPRVGQTTPASVSAGLPSYAFFFHQPVNVETIDVTSLDVGAIPTNVARTSTPLGHPPNPLTSLIPVLYLQSSNVTPCGCSSKPPWTMLDLVALTHNVMHKLLCKAPTLKRGK
jgi:hypothetical protein